MNVSADRLKEYWFLHCAHDALLSSTNGVAMPADCDLQEGLDELESDLNSQVYTRLGMQPSISVFASVVLLRKITEQFQYDFWATRSLREHAVQSILVRKMQTATDMLQHCSYCGRFDGLRRCGGCRFTSYCSTRCAKKDWSTHKHNCCATPQSRVKITSQDVVHFFDEARYKPHLLCFSVECCQTAPLSMAIALGCFEDKECKPIFYSDNSIVFGIFHEEHLSRHHLLQLRSFTDREVVLESVASHSFTSGSPYNEIFITGKPFACVRCGRYCASVFLQGCQCAAAVVFSNLPLSGACLCRKCALRSRIKSLHKCKCGSKITSVMKLCFDT